MNKTKLKKILEDYDILEYERGGDRLSWVKIRKKVEGLCLFDLPKELNGLVHSFEVYKNGEICLYLEVRK